MKFRSRKLKILILIVVLTFSSWVLRMYNRDCTTRDLFADSNDLNWFSQYLDKEIDFCDANWHESLILNNGEERAYVSPSGRFKIEVNRGSNQREDLFFLDTQSKRRIQVESNNLNYCDFKWTKDEHFLIFISSVQRDDWFPAQIFISDTGTGRAMYLGDSKYYECELQH